MHRSASRLAKALLLATLLVILSASAAPTRPDTPTTVTGLSRMHRREIVDVEDGDIEEEEGLFDEDDREAGGESDVPEDTSNGEAETLQTNPEANPEAEPEDQAEETSAAPPWVPQPTAAALHERPEAQSKSNEVVTAWMRPDRIKFDGQQAPFVVPDGKDVTWYKIGGQAGEATTIAAQQIKEITDYKGNLVTATIGDVMIFQDGAIAEAIGSVMPNGKRGELYNIIACNVQTEKGKCIMVDYDGREVKETLSKIITGSSSTVPVNDPSQAPAALRQWASNVMVLNVATVTAKARSRQKRSQGGLRF